MALMLVLIRVYVMKCPLFPRSIEYFYLPEKTGFFLWPGRGVLIDPEKRCLVCDLMPNKWYNIHDQKLSINAMY